MYHVFVLNKACELLSQTCISRMSMVCSRRYKFEFAKDHRGSLTVLTQNNSSFAPV